ncbi:polysaccharide lyase family 14 protein [Mycena latifolia]|nr:polysaccharide lyase family 14 protein [Mycena latifolia]
MHDAHWSRRSHKALAGAARSQPVAEVARSTKPQRRTAKSLGRRSCKPPSSSSAAEFAAQPTSSVASTATTSTKSTATTKTTTKAASETSTSAKSTSTGSTGGVLSLGALFPAGTPGKSWTTSPKSSSALSLSDSTLKPTKVISALTHTYMSAPDGKQAMRAIYPEGSYTFTHDPQGGFSFYAPGPDSLDMTTAKTLTFGYSVFFEEGFDFNMGGKLPGLYGGNSLEIATGCSGGRRSTECYSARLMWRTGGMGEVYTYLPDYEVSGFEANKNVCDVAPFSECNPTYGASVGRGAFTFPTGEWTTVSQRVQLNDVGKANGAIQLWVNGKSVIEASGLILRDSSSGRHRGIQFQTFFGGSQVEWASPKTQQSYFSDFSVAIIESL